MHDVVIGGNFSYKPKPKSQYIAEQVEKAKTIKETVKNILNEDISTENALLYAFLDTIAYEIRAIDIN